MVTGESHYFEGHRYRLNLELIKKPPACLEYLLVHEMTHLRERYHNEHIRLLMEQFLPNWQLRRGELNRVPRRARSGGIK